MISFVLPLRNKTLAMAVLILMGGVVAEPCAQTQPATVNLDTDLNGSNGTIIAGAVAGGQVGQFVAGLGDINGDGWTDFAVGMPAATRPGESQRNEIYVIFGTGEKFPTGLDLDALADGVRGFRIVGTEGVFDSIGRLFSGIGDIDGDGYDDFYVANQFIGITQVGGEVITSGESYIIHGQANWPTVLELSPVALPPNALRLRAALRTSWDVEVTGVGDFDGDGYADFALIGRTVDLSRSVVLNPAILIYGGPQRLPTEISIPNLDLARYRSLGVGLSIAGVGDVDGDGLDDLALGASSEADQPASIYFGQSRASETPLRRFRMDLPGLDDTGRFRHAITYLAPIGDMNGNGYKDFFAGSIFGSETFVVHGNPALSGLTVDLAEYVDGTDRGRGFRIATGGGNDMPPLRAGGLGDFNGDGFADLFINHEFGSDFASNISTAAMHRGRSNSYASPLLNFNDATSNGMRIQGNRTLGFRGYPSPVGDLDGDGIPDLIVGATNVSPGGLTNAGQLYVLYGYDRRFPVGTLPASGIWTEYFPAGLTGIRAVGQIRNGASADAESRLWLEFTGGAAAGGGASRATVALQRNTNGLSGFEQFIVAPVHWRLETNREEWTQANAILRYTPAEAQGLDLELLSVYTAPAVSGPWTLASGQIHEPNRRQINFILSNQTTHLLIGGPAATAPLVGDHWLLH